MKQHYTPEQLIPFIYLEFDLFDRLEIEFALEEDSKLCDEYHQLTRTIETLDECLISPPATLIESILQYSR